jgi:adenine/guanine phosphoribosyltransferase-like PRPP-binding protein
MTTDEVIQIFRDTGAVLEGHFILTSGLRSPVFLQKARVFMHADKTAILCKALAEKIRREVPGRIDYVVGPAVGGIIPAYETSRHLGVPAIWVEREGGEFRLRRFEIERGRSRRRVHRRSIGRQDEGRRAAGFARRIRGSGLSGRPPAARTRSDPAGEARQQEPVT